MTASTSSPLASAFDQLFQIGRHHNLGIWQAQSLPLAGEPMESNHADTEPRGLPPTALRTELHLIRWQLAVRSEKQTRRNFGKRTLQTLCPFGQAVPNRCWAAPVSSRIHAGALQHA